MTVTNSQLLGLGTVHLLMSFGVAVASIGFVVSIVALTLQSQNSQSWLPQKEAWKPPKWSQFKNMHQHWLGKRAIRIWHWHHDRWLKCGYEKAQAEQRTWKWLAMTGGVTVLVVLSQWQRPWQSLWALGLLEAVFVSLTQAQMKARQVEFATGVYRIYRYMALQLTAGMSPSETLKHLHEAVSEPFLKEAVYSFSSCYFRTMDLELATGELTKRISGDEIHVLATVLRQGIETGDPYGLVQKQEQLMLKRYYAALETETAIMQAKGIALAVGLCFLVFILLAVPMLYEMGRASRSIFTT